jgi:hypothetical protein
MAIMLTKDRPELQKRALDAFLRQTYKHKGLFMLNTGAEDVPYHGSYCWEDGRGRTIGALRNHAIAQVKADIIVHWDDDDWSHPNRIAEQVELLQSSGADAVGYYEMLFWREREKTSGVMGSTERAGESWLYTGTILGTSLCYWRKTWEAQPFPATSYGEDTEWLKLLVHEKKKVDGVKSFGIDEGERIDWETPRIVARIHGGNTSKAYSREAMLDAPHHWKRVPEWDDYCREVME